MCNALGIEEQIHIISFTEKSVQELDEGNVVFYSCLITLHIDNIKAKPKFVCRSSNHEYADRARMDALYIMYQRLVDMRKRQLFIVRDADTIDF